MAGLRRGRLRGEALRRRAPARGRAKGRQVGWSTQPFERQCSTSPTSGGSSRRQQRRAERGARGMREGAGVYVTVDVQFFGECNFLWKDMETWGGDYEPYASSH